MARGKRKGAPDTRLKVPCAGCGRKVPTTRLKIGYCPACWVDDRLSTSRKSVEECGPERSS